MAKELPRLHTVDRPGAITYVNHYSIGDICLRSRLKTPFYT